MNFAISSGIGSGQPIYITTTTPTLSQPQLPQQQITLAPISSTQQFGNNGTTGATVASPGKFQPLHAWNDFLKCPPTHGWNSNKGYQIINQPQIIQIAPQNQVLQLQSAQSPQPEQIIYGNQLSNQFILQPLNLPLGVTTQNGGAAQSPRIIRLQSTPVIQSPTTPTPQPKKIHRRQSLQPSTASPNTIITSSLINPSVVPQKTQLYPANRRVSMPSTPSGRNTPVQSTTALHHHQPIMKPQFDLIGKIENDPTLSAREKVIKIRQEMKRRYDMLRPVL